jgi:hypothetical protein
MCKVFITNSYKYRKREGIEAIDICCRSEKGHFFSPFKYENVECLLSSCWQSGEIFLLSFIVLFPDTFKADLNKWILEPEDRKQSAQSLFIEI